MTAKIGHKAAVATLVQVSIELDRLLETTLITQLFLRSLETSEHVFVQKGERSWISRSWDRVQSLGSKVTPYSLEANMAYLHELTEIVIKSPITAPEAPNPELVRRFQNSVPEALSSLLVRLEALVARAQKPALQIARTKALFEGAFKTHFETKRQVLAIVRGFLKDDRYAIFTSTLVQKLFDQYQQLLADIHRRIATGIASQEEAHELRERLEKEMLATLQKRLHALFELFKQQAIQAIKAAKNIEQFHEAKQHIQEDVKALIAIDQRLTSKPICALFCAEMQAFSDAVLEEEMPRYSELITAEVLPQIQHFLTEAEHKGQEELKVLVQTVENYIEFLEKVALELRCPNNATSCPQSLLLDRAIAMLKSGKQSIAKKMALQDVQKTVQTSSGTGNNVVNAHTVTIIQGKHGAEECSIDDNVMGGIIPKNGLHALQYGSTILVSAATYYVTSGVSLGWSLVAGVVFTAAPTVAKGAARQVLPRAVVSVMDPLIDFAARLLIWRYGTSTIQMMAGQRPQPQEPAQVGPVQQFINSDAIPIALGTLDVVKHVRKKEPTQVPVASKPHFAVPQLDATGLFTKSVAYLSALFWMTKKSRETSI